MYKLSMFTVFVLPVVLQFSCTSSGGKPSYPAPVDNGLYTIQDTAAVPVVEQFTLKAEGTATYFGETFTILKSDTVDNPTQPRGVKVPFKIESGVFKIPQIEVFRPNGTDPAHTYPDLSILPNKTMTFDMNPPVNTPQKIQVTGDLVVGDPAIAQNHMTFTNKDVTYTLVDDKASVETPMGVVTNTKKYTVSLTYIGEKITGTIWYKDNLGLVAAMAESVLLPSKYAYGLKNVQTGGAHGTGTYVVQGVGVVNQTSGLWKLDTYQLKGKFDVDKDQHSYYLLEMRWADPARAQTTEMPPINFAFTTVWGIFPESYSTPIQSPVSLFGDEDGYVYWEVFASEGAKNETVNPIAVSITAQWNAYSTVKAGDVQVQARIDYPLYLGP
jgi:hypothetical protein